MDFQIKLRPLVGQMRGRDGIVRQVTQEQYCIFVTAEGFEKVRGKSEELIGYVGTKPGDPINFLKVSAAFGNSTVQIFERMVRKALLEEAKQRIVEAQAAVKEAEELKAEAAALIADGQQLGDGNEAVNDAISLADAAIAEANKHLNDASEQASAEEELTRKANAPDPAVIQEIRDKAAKKSKGTKAQPNPADEQNL